MQIIRSAPLMSLSTLTALISFNACLKTSDDIRAEEDALQAGEVSQVVTEHTEWCHADDCAQLQWSPLSEGSFLMGEEGEDLNHSPPQSVDLAPFDLLISEVTVGQYRACVALGVCDAPSVCDEGEGTWTEEPALSEGLPISCVTFEEAQVFASWAGGRLPTEAEWEYATRSEGVEGLYPWGERPPMCSYANVLSCVQAPSPICQRPDGHSYQGVCDLIGNQLEWVVTLDEHKPTGLENFEIGKGGSWVHSAEMSMASYRLYLTPEARLPYVGFRVVR